MLESCTKRHVLSALGPQNRKGVEQCAPRPNEIAALPFLWPTRLADGLELEVFYVSWPNSEPHDSPRVSLCETLVPPRCRCFESAATSADIKFSTAGYYSSKNMRINLKLSLLLIASAEEPR